MKPKCCDRGTKQLGGQRSKVVAEQANDAKIVEIDYQRRQHLQKVLLEVQLANIRMIKYSERHKLKTAGTKHCNVGCL